MAIYSFRATPVGGSRGGARASAADWCRYVERRDEYAHKGGLECSFVALPDGAPAAWADPAALAAALDEREGAGGHVATEYMGALPNELTAAQCEELAREFAASLAADGRCCHGAIHSGPDGHNRHLHLTAAVRSLTAKGEWEAKRAVYYLVRRGGEDMEIPAAAWKDLKADGWEKVYPMKDGRQLTKSEALGAGLDWKTDRKGSQPVKRAEHVTDWTSKGALYAYRERWAATVNDYLARYAPETEPIDHRSNAERGLETVPSVHLGHAAHAMEQRGIATINGEINRAVEAVNDELAKTSELPAEATAVEVEQVEVERQRVLEDGYALAVREYAGPAEVASHRETILGGLARTFESVMERIERLLHPVLPEPVANAVRRWMQSLNEYINAVFDTRATASAAREYAASLPASAAAIRAAGSEYGAASADLWRLEQQEQPAAWNLVARRNHQAEIDRAQQRFEVAEQVVDGMGGINNVDNYRHVLDLADEEIVNAERMEALALNESRAAERGLAAAVVEHEVSLETAVGPLDVDAAAEGIVHDSLDRVAAHIDDLMVERELDNEPSGKSRLQHALDSVAAMERDQQAARQPEYDENGNLVMHSTPRPGPYKRHEEMTPGKDKRMLDQVMPGYQRGHGPSHGRGGPER